MRAKAKYGQVRAMLLSRPISPAERSHLLALGAHVESLRKSAALTRSEVAVQTGLNSQSIYRIERGLRRTRRRTLRIIVAVVADDPEDALDCLVKLAGPALAEESQFVDRIERRRLRRVRRHQVLLERERYEAARERVLAEWERRSTQHLEIRSWMRMIDRSFRWLNWLEDPANRRRPAARRRR
jgi:transcriptional regulator with XRE-family HTH domain